MKRLVTISIGIFVIALLAGAYVSYNLPRQLDQGGTEASTVEPAAGQQSRKTKQIQQQPSTEKIQQSIERIEKKMQELEQENRAATQSANKENDKASTKAPDIENLNAPQDPGKDDDVTEIIHAESIKQDKADKVKDVAPAAGNQTSGDQGTGDKNNKQKTDIEKLKSEIEQATEKQGGKNTEQK